MTEDKEGGRHVFDPENWQRLESPQRRERMNPVKLAEAMGLAGDEVVLDIGCGTGYFAEPVAERCGRLIGIDHSEDMLNVFRGKESFGKLTNVELKLGDAMAPPVDDGSCDIVFHACLLHEIKDAAAFHRDIKRVLKPGGRLYSVDWHARDTGGMGPPVDHRVSQETAMEWMRRDGFKDVEALEIYDDQYVIVGRV